MRRPVAALAAMLLSACASAHRPAGPAATPAAAPPQLPPVPLVEGPLAIHVVYPASGALIAARDSNFIFGSVGNGHAALTINGAAVTVRPNGSFLAWLPVPPSDAPRYELVAALGADTARTTHEVRLLPPRPVLALDGTLVVDSASVTPHAGSVLALRDDEPVRVSVRAPSNASAWVLLDSTTRRALVNDAAARAAADSTGSARGDSTLWSTDVSARLMRGETRLVVARGADTVRLPLAAVAAPAVDGAMPVAVLGAERDIAADTDIVITARPVPEGTYKWFLLPGTRVQVTGRSGAFVRVQLDDALEAWVNAADARLLPAGTGAPRRVAANARVVPDSAWVDLVIPVTERPPYLVEERDHAIDLTIYGVRTNTDIVHYGHNDPLVREVTWTPERTERARFTVRLSTAPYGYLVFYDHGALVLRIRRPPRIDRRAPLRGRTIVVDPGHPPAGATGPTGLYEGVAVLEIGKKLAAMLEQRGAHVIMTRTTNDPVALGDRPILARRANADVLVSVHLNALPDGVNPFTAHGTGTYFFRSHSAPLARAIQERLVARMGLRNIGIFYDNLALTRPTWMPAVLTEGAFIMIPEQEAALRTPEFQTAYARGIAEGLERYFRERAEDDRAEGR
ncbi:MAG TPA: N-acetylmuramoyl-L-alanine amidase [Gemmatimonadaceae bacterium]|nr:N-acetylmuramoyl-L-alanine amidase [Gemmatimonadaceae bacterium]